MPDLTRLFRLKTTQSKAIKSSIVMPNRLEGNPRIEDFGRSLRAEMKDPLWTLCRQWQFGEFIGEDAGTACETRILGEHRSPVEIEIKNKSIAYDAKDAPLEMLVEREIPTPTLHLKCQAGQQWLRFLKQNSLKSYGSVFKKKYPISSSALKNDREGRYLETALEGLYPNGIAIINDIKSGKFEDWINTASEVKSDADKEKLLEVTPLFLNWYHTLYQQPEKDESAWIPERLEYNFSLSTEENSSHKLVAEEYSSGHLDWYSFNQKGKMGSPKEEKCNVQTFIPMSLKYAGMPHPRYWQMEENTTDFGKSDASPTSLISLLLAHYGLTYSNDWFVIPYEMKVNTICDLRGIVVKDVFGVHTIIEPTIKDPEKKWHEFALFHQTELDGNTKNRSLFYLPPSVGKLMKGKPLEKVNFMRDEMGNMVWAIEQTLPSEAGGGFDNKQVVPKIDDNFVPVGDEAAIRYILGTTVPDNYIPFIAAHKNSTQREVRLQRARLPQASPARSKILTETQPVYFIEEEEISRAGVIVEQCYQRTRWLNGKTYLWLGRRKMTGRGESRTGLKFDQITNI
ncbi:MAG: hypothetical protein ACI85O_000133 [Saprospiraceae bacterium]|jgi:hypothetical protein